MGEEARGHEIKEVVTLETERIPTIYIYRERENNFKSKHDTLQRPRCSSFKVVMYIQKLHHFCNTSFPDDDPKSSRETWEINNYGRCINQFPPNTMRSIWQYVCYIQRNLCIYICTFVYIYIVYISNINHLLAHDLNDFKYHYISTIDLQSPPSNAIKIKLCWIFVFHLMNLKITDRRIVLVPALDKICRLIGSGLSDHPSSPVKALVVQQVTWSLCLSDHGLLSLQNSVHKHYGWLYINSRGWPPAAIYVQSAYSTTTAVRESLYIYIYIFVCLCFFVSIYIHVCVHVCVCVCEYISKVGDHSRGWPEGSLFDSYYTKVYGRAILLSLDCSTLPLIHTL